MSSNNRRTLRSMTTKLSSAVPPSVISPSICWSASSPSASHHAIPTVVPGSRLSGLTSAELSLLRRKQRQLMGNAPSTLKLLLSRPQLRNALESTLIFSQREAGTAVCINGAGWLLTCAHCFGDTEAEWKSSANNRRKWLLFYTGLAVQAECQIWDIKRDLALLKIVAVESSVPSKDLNDEVTNVPTFPSVPLSSRSASFKTPIACIGQPGRDDLESVGGGLTPYNLVEVSEGMVHGMIAGADPQDNSVIGTLKHDAWTYWGHSGAPLLREKDGTLIGLHSSWDDQTAMRHGIPLVAITGFLQEHHPHHLFESEDRCG